MAESELITATEAAGAAQKIYEAFVGVFNVKPTNPMQLVKFAASYKSFPRLSLGDAKAAMISEGDVVIPTNTDEEKAVMMRLEVAQLVSFAKVSPIDEHVDTLPGLCQSHPGFEEILVKSLVKADEEAKATMTAQVYDDYKKVFGWPVTLDEYMVFLRKTGRWVPHQEPYDGWKDIVHTPSGSEETNYLEVLAMLCHFSFMIDQEVEDSAGDKKVPAKEDYFDEWITIFSRLWGEFLDTPESFSEEILQTYIDHSPIFKMDQFLFSNDPKEPRNIPNNPSHWMSFNQFFARIPIAGYRPLADPANNNIVTCPADFTLVQDSNGGRAQIFNIDANGNVLSPTTGGATTEVLVKGTKIIGNVKDILDESEYAELFYGGKMSNYFLSTYDVHRFYSPVSGRVLENRRVQGKVYVNITLEGSGLHAFPFNAPVDLRTGFQFDQTRGVFIIDTRGSPQGDIGLVAVCPIGLSQVSGVNMTVPAGAEILKGDEFGYFQFGGSDMVILFSNPNVKVDQKISPQGHAEHRLCRSKLAELLLL